jgi:hypothetical protein
MILNRFGIIFKVGDNEPFRDGMPVCAIDELEWGETLETIISRFTTRVFCCIEMDRKFKSLMPVFLSPVPPIGNLDIMAQSEYVRPVRVDYSALETKLNIPGLETTLRSTVDSPGIINGVGLSLEDFIDVRNGLPVDKQYDLNSVSSGSYTVGTSLNYATWALALADIANLTGDLTFTQQTNITESAAAVMNKNLAGHVLTFTTDQSHLGVQAQGRLKTDNFTTAWAWDISIGTGGTLNLSNLNIKRQLASATDCGSLLLRASTGNTTATWKDILIDGIAKATYGIYFLSANLTVNLFNAIIANCQGTGSQASVFVSAVNAASIFHNITIHSAASSGHIGIQGLGSGCSAINCAVFGEPTCYAGISGTYSKCASSDTSGSESGLRSLTELNQVVSADITSADSFKVKKGGICYDGGSNTVIAGNNHGIRGNTRPHGVKFSIGADEAPSIPVGFPFSTFMKAA